MFLFNSDIPIVDGKCGICERFINSHSEDEFEDCSAEYDIARCKFKCRNFFLMLVKNLSKIFIGYNIDE